MNKRQSAEDITELPLEYAGRLFRSVMPFSRYDQDNGLFQKIKQQNISIIVLLAEDEECIQQAGRDLRALYQQEGLTVIHLPVPDFSTPEKLPLEQAVQEALEHLSSGMNVLVHCHAGMGRTGTFSACLVKQALGVGGQEAVDWIRSRLPGALETREQVDLVLKY